MKKIAFSIDKYELQEINNSQFSKLRLYICHDLDNKNKSYISFESMKNAESTLLNKPIIMKLNKLQSDFEEHEPDTIVVGFIPETGHNIHYEVINDRNYLVADAVIWKYYSSKTLEIFKKDKNKKISMEIQVLSEHRREDGLIQFDEYTYLAVCLLGNRYDTGMHDTNASLIDFSKSNDVDLLQKEWNSFIKFEYNEESDVQNQEKEVGVMDLENLEKDKEVNVEDIEDVEKEKKVEESKEDESEEMLKDKDAEKCLSEDSKEEDSEEMSEDSKEEDSEDEDKKGEDEDIKDEYVKDEEVKEEEMKEQEDEKVEDEEMKKDDKKDKYSALENENKILSENLSSKENAILEMSANIKDLELAKEELLTEVETLREFKLSIDSKAKNEKVNEVFSNLSNVLTKEDIDTWKNRVSEFESVEIFEKEIKSFACDKIMGNREIFNKAEFSKMAVNLDNDVEDDEPEDNVWARINKTISK